MTFTVTIDQDEDGAWIVECSSIPGCVSQGKTREEALDNIRDAIKHCLEVRAERGLPPTIEQERRQATFRRTQGLWKDRDDIPGLFEELRREWDRVDSLWEERS
jgi:predicted RNase H-like HicB family nuclease